MFLFLEESALSQWLNGLMWGFPGAEIFHIFMTGGFFGAVLLMDLRLLGLHSFFSIDLLMRKVVPYIGWLFGGVVLSGSILICFMPAEYSVNPALRIKFLLIILGGVNALFMHKVLMKNYMSWGESAAVPWPVKFSALLSLVIWAGCLACGRLIAYYYNYYF